MTEENNTTEQQEDSNMPSMSAIEGFYHLYTVAKFPDETDDQFTERKAAREIFTEQLREQGLTPEQFFSMIQQPQVQPKLADNNFIIKPDDGPLINRLIKRIH